MLKEDVNVLRHIGTPEQLEALGVPVKKREAFWQHGETDLIAPNFGAAWGGSPEEAEQASKVQQYTEAMRKRLWGDER